MLWSEQDAERPIVGVPDTFQALLGPEATLFRMHDGLAATDKLAIISISAVVSVVATVKWVWQNYKVIIPGTNLVLETVGTYLFGKRFAIDENWRWIRIGTMTTSVWARRGARRRVEFPMVRRRRGRPAAGVGFD